MISRVVCLTAALLIAPCVANAAPSPEAKKAHDEGVERLANKQFREAQTLLKKAVTLSPDYTEAWVALGNASLAAGEFDQAAEALDKALSLNPDQNLARYNLAYALRKGKKYKRAAEAYRVYLQAEPEDADAYYGLAEALRNNNEPLAAADAYDRYAALEKRPERQKWVSQSQTKASELRRRHAPKGAAAKSEKQSPSPKPAPAKAGVRPMSFLAGVDAMKSGKYEEALPKLIEAQRARPKDAFVLSALAGCYLGLGDADDAVLWYRRALSEATDTARPAIQFGLAEALRTSGDLAEAQKALEAVSKSKDKTFAPMAKSRLTQL